VSSDVRNLPSYDELTDVDIFLDALEREVPEIHYFHALNWSLHTTPTRWWGMHKGSFDDWYEYRRMVRIHFGRPKVWMKNKYDGRDDPCDHLAKWAKDYGGKVEPKWVHLFCHTLDVIPMNWYLETKLRHGTEEWYILCQVFIIPFKFEDGFEYIDEALQEVKVVIFRIPRDPLDLIQPDWTTQMSHTPECYNVTIEEEDDVPRKINIPKNKGHHEVEGPKVENPNITALLKSR